MHDYDSTITIATMQSDRKMLICSIAILRIIRFACQIEQQTGLYIDNNIIIIINIVYKLDVNIVIEHFYISKRSIE